MVENHFPHAHAFRRYFNQLVFLDVFESFLKREHRARNNLRLVVRAAGTCVCQLFRLCHVHDKVVVVDMFADNLTGVDLLARVDEELAAVLQLVNRVGVGRARLHRYHRAVKAAGNISLVRLVLLEAVSHNRLALTCRQYVGAEADNAARGDVELDVHAVGLTLHRRHFALAACNHVDHLACKLFGHVYCKLLDRLAFHAVNLLVDYLRLTHLKLVTLTAHCLDEYRQVEHAAPADNPFVSGVLKGSHAQGEVLFEFFLQAVVDVAAGDELSFLAEERRVVDGEQHAHRRLVDGYRRQRLRVLEVADGVTYFKLFKTYDGADVAAAYAFGAHMAHALEGVNLLDLGLLHAAVAVGYGNVHALGERAPVDSSHSNTSGIA